MKKHFLKIMLFCTLGIFCSSCEEGENGLDGIDGIDGVNGSDGENGVGFDELSKFGAITLNLEGTRPDGVPFTKTDVFKFIGVEDIDFENTVFTDPDTSLLEFDTVRFLSTPDEEFQGSEVEVFAEVTNPGEQNQEILIFIGITDYAIIGDDLSFFRFDDSFETDDTGVSNVSITNFNFNNETNAFTISFSFDVDAANNSTGNDLSVSGEVDVIVFEDIEDIGSN
ncbi:hypothetical protein [uncultured Aquimarina sp.]|uniref:hypothetical protein n=1 Tax=uncultured Aquimarina sp. TaxID=575652 RepID=UPI002614F37E|nr:hypothetical protein [uncultured Aquimarina sp.]